MNKAESRAEVLASSILAYGVCYALSFGIHRQLRGLTPYGDRGCS